MKQKIKAILDDDRGVSPVIGVILMVAITVILAAVIGTFVLGLGDSLQQAPQAQLQIEEPSPGNFEIAHKGGDTLQAGDIRIEGATVDSWPNGANGDISVGETITLTSGSVSSGDTITIIHEPSDSIIVEAEA